MENFITPNTPLSSGKYRLAEGTLSYYKYMFMCKRSLYETGCRNI